jgi:hypothetical protein
VQKGMLPLQEIYQKKKFVWSFYGTGWQGREMALAPLRGIQPNSVRFFSTWLDSQQLNKEDYISMLRASLFVPCPRGNNVETFRLYEVLENGSIPILVKDDSQFIQTLKKKLPFILYENWEEAAKGVVDFLQNQQKMIEYHVSILNAWNQWKDTLKIILRKMV